MLEVELARAVADVRGHLNSQNKSPNTINIQKNKFPFLSIPETISDIQAASSCEYICTVKRSESKLNIEQKCNDEEVSLDCKNIESRIRMKGESDQDSSSSGSAAISPLDQYGKWETIRKLENLDLYEITFSNNVKKTVGFDAMAELVNQRSLTTSMKAEIESSDSRPTSSTMIERRPGDQPDAKVVKPEYETTKMELSSSAKASSQLPTTVKTADPGEKARTFGRSSSKYFGVSWHSQRKRWRAYIYLSPGRQKYLGTFEDQVEAALAYDNAVKEHRLRSPLNFGVNLASKAPKQKKRQLSVFKEAALKLQGNGPSSALPATVESTAQLSLASSRNQPAEWLHMSGQSEVLHNQLQPAGSLSGSKKTKVNIHIQPELSMGPGFPNVYQYPVQPSPTQPVSPIRYAQPTLPAPGPFSLPPHRSQSLSSTNTGQQSSTHLPISHTQAHSHIPPFIQYQNQQQQQQQAISQYSAPYQVQKPVSPTSTYNRPLWTTAAAAQLEHHKQQQLLLESFQRHQQQQHEQNQQQQQRHQRDSGSNM